MKWFNVWVIGFLMCFWYGAYSAIMGSGLGMIWSVVGFLALAVAYILYDTSNSL